MGTKKIQKPFDLEAWKNGAKIETRDGRPVRIICTDLNSICDERTLVAAVTTRNGEESVRRFCQNGRYFSNGKDGGDIVIVEEVEERWAEDKKARGNGWTISQEGVAGTYYAKGIPLNDCFNYDVFATMKQAKSALAMARISQLMAHDERYGGVVNILSNDRRTNKGECPATSTVQSRKLTNKTNVHK